MSLSSDAYNRGYYCIDFGFGSLVQKFNLSDSASRHSKHLGLLTKKWRWAASSFTFLRKMMDIASHAMSDSH
jgi:hypothetical protein